MGKMVSSKEKQWGRKVKRLLNPHLGGIRRRPESGVLLFLRLRSSKALPPLCLAIGLGRV